jgi:hypothetical protein
VAFRVSNIDGGVCKIVSKETFVSFSIPTQLLRVCMNSNSIFKISVGDEISLRAIGSTDSIETRVASLSEELGEWVQSTWGN